MPLDPNKFTRKTGEALQAAPVTGPASANHAQVATRAPVGVVAPASPKDGPAGFSSALGWPQDAARTAAEQSLGKIPQVYGAGPTGPTLPGGVPGPGVRGRGTQATWATTTSPRSTSCSPMTDLAGGGRGISSDRWVSPGRRSSTRSRRCGGRIVVTSENPRGSVPGARALRAGPHRRGHARASSTPSSAVMRRFAGSIQVLFAPDQEQPGADRASLASARRRSSKDWRAANHRR